MLKESSRQVLKTSSRCLEDQQTFAGKICQLLFKKLAYLNMSNLIEKIKQIEMLEKTE